MSDHWKDMEVQPSFKEWLGMYQGCLICDCGHGCADWVKEQGRKAALLMRILSNPKATTSLEKVTQMPLERANRIWWRIMHGEMRTFNRKLREEGNE